MSKRKKQNPDPFYHREKTKYETPIPSREYILSILEGYGKPMSMNRLTDALALDDENALKALTFRLKAMIRDGQIMQDRRGRFCLLAKLSLKKGRVQAHPDGYGFFIPDEGGGDMLLSPKEMRKVMHGDIILAHQTTFDRRGRMEGSVHEVLEHANVTVVGRLSVQQGVGFLIPDNKRITHDISVPLTLSNGATDGQIVLAEIVAFPTDRNQPIAKIIQILGEHMAPGLEIDVAMVAHGIPYQFSDDVLNEVNHIPSEVTKADFTNRTDLRQLDFVTIDGEDAMDFDDAVYCVQKPKGGFTLYVAIADVSHYVKINSFLDKTAEIRGNSVYFPGRVIPMLPEALSNGICSLNPHVDRCAMVAELSISKEGKMTRSRFYRAVFQSKARLTYNAVNEWLTNNNPPKEYAHLFSALEALHAVYKVLLSARQSRGAIDFDSIETKIIFDDNRKIDKILPVFRNDAHRLIEECMLVANVAVAKHLEKEGIATLYRNHLGPDEEKLEGLRQFLLEFGLKLSGGKSPTGKDYQKTLEQVKDRPEKSLVETVMLRSLKQAQYTEENQGHFGLSFPCYTHFTSPIRRYPDLLIHRAIGHILDNQPISTFHYSSETMHRLGQHCSMTERRADEATRDVVNWLKCEFMQSKLGQVFTGKISTVTSFGLFVSLDDIYVEGLVHITSLKTDYYRHDTVLHALVGERSATTYRLGDKLSVLVARVDVDERKIDFELTGN